MATDTITPKGKYTESLTFSTPDCIYADYGKLGKSSLQFSNYHLCTNCVFDININKKLESTQRDPSKLKRAKMSTNEAKQRPNKYNRIVGISINKHGTNKCK